MSYKKNPTTRELCVKLDALKEITEIGFSHIKEDLTEIKERQDKTNGNVIRNTKFRYQAMGALAILTFMVGIISWDKISNLFK